MRALVAYGSKYGSTKGIAERVAKNLGESGMSVDLKDIMENDVKADGYDLMVVGTGIYAGKWMKPVQRFLKDNAAKQGERKMAVFVCCLDASDPKKKDEAVKNYITDVLAGMPGLKVTSTATFAGELDFNKYGFVVKKIMKSIVSKRAEENGKGEPDWTKSMDFRDWAAIDAWSKDLASRSK